MSGNAYSTELVCSETEPGSWLLYPADLSARVQSCWFDREYWGAAAQPLAAERGGRSAPLLLPTDPGPSVWRHYQRGGAVAQLLGDRYLWRGLQRCRPWREMSITLDLHRLGLAVPRPLAARVTRSGAWYRGDLLTQCLENTQTLAQRWTAESVSYNDCSELGLALAKLHNAGCDHADLNAHNLLFDKDDQVWVLDFDRAVIRASAGPWCEANLSRLQRSLSKVGQPPSAQQWQALLESYCLARA